MAFKAIPLALSSDSAASAFCSRTRSRFIFLERHYYPLESMVFIQPRNGFVNRCSLSVFPMIMAGKRKARNIVDKVTLSVKLRKMKIVRLTKNNSVAVDDLVKESHNELLTVGKAANLCVEKGLPSVRRKYVKNREAQPA